LQIQKDRNLELARSCVVETGITRPITCEPPTVLMKGLKYLKYGRDFGARKT